MPRRNIKLLGVIAAAGVATLVSASAQAQYLTRSYHYRSTYPYNAQAQYVGTGVNVLPQTIVNGNMAQTYYDPYGMMPSVYGCCWTTNNENIGLVGAGGASR